MTRSSIPVIVKHILLLFVVLFALALITRMPALYFANIYALHGVLSAAFFAAVLVFCYVRRIAVWQYCGALLALAGVLSFMSPVMGLSFLVVALVTFAASCLLAKVSLNARALVGGVAVGLACYLAPVATGTMFGSFVLAGGAVLQFMLLTLVSGLLGAVGAMVALMFLSGADDADGASVASDAGGASGASSTSGVSSTSDAGGAIE